MKILRNFAAICAFATLTAACDSNETTSTTSSTPLESRGCGYRGLERNDGTIYSMEQEIVRQVNELRAQNGLAALRQHGCISSVAYFHSVNMAKQNNASHVLDGLDPRARLVRQDISVSWSGENIQLAWWTRNGQPFWDTAAYPNVAMNFWKNSPGHRANMLSPNFQYLGVGISKTQVGEKGYYYATQVFMTE